MSTNISAVTGSLPFIYL